MQCLCLSSTSRSLVSKDCSSPVCAFLSLDPWENNSPRTTALCTSHTADTPVSPIRFSAKYREILSETCFRVTTSSNRFSFRCQVHCLDSGGSEAREMATGRGQRWLEIRWMCWIATPERFGPLARDQCGYTHYELQSDS